MGYEHEEKYIEKIKEIQDGDTKMKIIKQGKMEEELKAILNKTKRFKCKTCECIFEADKGEYEYSSSCRNEDGYYYCVCPNCKKNAHEVKQRETDKKAEDKPKVCYDSGCIHHVGIDGCKLTFPTGTSFEKIWPQRYELS